MMIYAGNLACGGTSERQAKMRAAPADKNTELVMLMTRNSNPSPNHNPVKGTEIRRMHTDEI